MNLIHAPIHPRFLVIGGDSLPDLLTKPDWSAYVPEFETQSKYWLQTNNCFSYDAEVLMGDYRLKKISEIRVGESVISHTGKKRRVSEVMSKDFGGDIFKIRVNGIGEELRCTGNHPFLLDGGVWTEASKLKVGDYVSCPTVSSNTDYSRFPVESDDGFLWLLGIYLAEGTCIKHKGVYTGRVSFSISTEEVELATKIDGVLFRLFGLHARKQVNKGTKSLVLSVQSSHLVDVFTILGGVGAAEKRLAPHLIEIEPRRQMMIVRGWADGDGCFSEKDSVKRFDGVSISKNLINQIMLMLARSGIVSYMTVRKAVANHKKAYVLNVFGGYVERMAGEYSKDHRMKIKKSKFNGKNLSRRIDRIEVVPSTAKHGGNRKIYKVYNLEVEEDHSYTVGSVAVHNCVQASFENCIEMMTRHFGRHLNGSERFLGWASDCKGYGNSFSNCVSGFVDHFICAEELWPWDRRLTRDEYFAEPSEEAKTDAMKRKEDWEFRGVAPVTRTWEGYQKALLKTPIWFCNENHAMVIYSAVERDGKRLIGVQDTFGGDDGDGRNELDFDNLPWEILAAYNIAFAPKGTYMPKIMNQPLNSFIVVTDGLGEIFANIDNTCLIKDEMGLVNVVLNSRNSKPCPKATCKHTFDGDFVPHNYVVPAPIVNVLTKDIAGVPVLTFKEYHNRKKS